MHHARVPARWLRAPPSVVVLVMCHLHVSLCRGHEDDVFKRGQPNLFCNHYYWVPNPEERWPDKMWVCNKVSRLSRLLRPLPLLLAHRNRFEWLQ